jgi:hypothetical protein
MYFHQFPASIATSAIWGYILGVLASLFIKLTVQE